MKHPKTIPHYETSDGKAVKTIAEWKAVELLILMGCDSTDAPSELKTNCESWVARMISDSENVVGILSVRERGGRPNGAKDRKPRVKRTAEASAAKAA